MGESWSHSCVQTSLCLTCTYDLGQDSPIQTDLARLIRAKSTNGFQFSIILVSVFQKLYKKREIMSLKLKAWCSVVVYDVNMWHEAPILLGKSWTSACPLFTFQVWWLQHVKFVWSWLLKDERRQPAQCWRNVCLLHSSLLKQFQIASNRAFSLFEHLDWTFSCC